MEDVSAIDALVRAGAGNDSVSVSGGATTLIGGKGNEGVTGQVKQAPGAIGYVEQVYAQQNDLATAHMQNRSGAFVESSVDGATAAAAGAAEYRPDSFHGAGDRLRLMRIREMVVEGLLVLETLLLLLVAYLVPVAPVSWVYMLTKRLRYDPSLVQSMFLLPIVVAGILLVGYAGVHPSVGAGYEFQAITAVVLGGVVLGGGRGWLLSAAAGAFALELLFSFLNFQEIESTWRPTVQGVIIILAVAAAGGALARDCARGGVGRAQRRTQPHPSLRRRGR